MNKLYHSISEVSSLIGEEQHILRYWEKEFEQLRPRKNRGGNRIYSEKDLQIIKMIKKYIRDDKLSLKGAKERLERYVSGEAENTLFRFACESPEKNLSGVVDSESISKNKISIDKSELEEIYNILKNISYILK